MSIKRVHLALLVGLLLSPFSATCATYYVNAGNTAPASPFATWATAATNIQDAVNLTSPGDTVLVTNGSYAYSGLAVAGTLLNRVALTNPITVQSVNGPWVTTILGAGAVNGASAVRCAWLTNGASLVGFTLTAGATQSSGDQTTLEDGGGVWCASSNVLVANCVIVSNNAWQFGSGVYQGTVVNSLVNSNADNNLDGGAAYKTVLNNCTLVGNATYGVASPLAMTNCIIYFNGPLVGNYSVSGHAFVNCCTTPALAGIGNFTNAPQLFADGIHLATNSPCIGAGAATATGTDIFGLTWANPPSVGCAEWNPAPVIFPQPTIQFPTTGGVTIGVNVDGQPPIGIWWTKDGAPVPNNGHYGSPNAPALSLSSVALGDAGAYQVTVSNSFGMVTSAVLQVSAHCVSESGTEQPPYSSWVTAATNIQDALNVAQAGDFVLVTNGSYAYGGLAVVGSLTNRVALTNAILVQSVNGPWATTILGAGANNGNSAVRCAWLTNGASLTGFTLQAGATLTSGTSTTTESGGGAWCASSNALIANCVIASNAAAFDGVGVYQGTLMNSLISSNGGFSSQGAAYGTVLNNCTVISNACYGVISPPAMTNCIIYYNVGLNVSQASGSAYSHCCTTMPSLAGTGNFTNLPQLFPDGVHLSTNSPCVGAGFPVANGTDIFGNAWSNPPSIGCAELPSSPVVAAPQIQVSGSPAGFTVSAVFTGASPLSFFWLQNGVPLQDNGHDIGSQTPALNVSWAGAADAGGYQLVVSNSFGMVTSAVVQLTVHLVNANGFNPVSPYNTWATAATNIQDAITAAAAGDIVLVTNGIYTNGGISMDGVITNRVSLTKAILVQSVNGANATIIQGAWDPVSTNGPGAVRCAWLTTNSVLAGFTLQGGATRGASGTGQSLYGGAVWGPRTNSISLLPVSTVANCIISSNAAYGAAGGAYEVNLNNCTVIDNTVTSGIGVGGGAVGCNMRNCRVSGNTAIGSSGMGGGVQGGILWNCAVTGNYAADWGGGAYSSTLTNCTVAGNAVGNASEGIGGGVYSCTLNNCIVYLNQTYDPNYLVDSNYYSSTFTYSCTAPAATGTGNITSSPLLLGDNIHLSPASPCIGAGMAGGASGTDIDGQPWNNPPSIGCDEWYPTPLVVSSPTILVGLPAFGLTCSVIVAGQPPFACYWTQNGSPIQDNGHFSNSSTTSLTVNGFGPNDAGVYQVVVSNAFGMSTSQVAQVVIHAVSAVGVNPTPPYSTWATAATNIQDAVNASSAGDIVLVTNGVYMYGGMVMSYNLTNRVAINLPITVVSVNGCFATAIQGAWDPVSTNGPDAMRCVWLGNGATLIGFTLQRGATMASDGYVDASDSGGGIYCLTTNGMAVNCVLSNNSAVLGGGMANGTLNNSLVLNNRSSEGGGAYSATLNNCTVANNLVTAQGGGTYGCFVENSIVVNNYMGIASTVNNYYNTFVEQYLYSCSSPAPSGASNINANPQFLDAYHISISSPCRGAGSAAYASGTDLDGEPWNNPPSMGCDEVVLSNLVGALTVNFSGPTNLVLGRVENFFGNYTGRASALNWNFGDGGATSNSPVGLHVWNTAGTYTLAFAAYNSTYPAGVSTNVTVQVQPLLAPQLLPPVISSNAFEFQFTAQGNVNYTIQYSTNLTPPIVWQTLQTIYQNQNNVIQIADPSWTTNGIRFYQVLAQ
jgi:hypothetical protein